MGFNTASGKHCCNEIISYMREKIEVEVSIPQAVSTVATLQTIQELCINIAESFNTASGKHCCNYKSFRHSIYIYYSFNTASGKHCCNEKILKWMQSRIEDGFNTASGKHCCNLKLLIKNWKI